MKVYTASKTKHAENWRNLRDVIGVDVISTWIDEAGPGETTSFEDLWLRCVGEASEADVLLLYMEPGEILKGALVEAGAALASGKTVYAVGLPSGMSFRAHPSVLEFSSLVDAVAMLQDMASNWEQSQR